MHITAGPGKAVVQFLRLIIVLLVSGYVQCFDTIVYVTGRASSP